MKIIHVYPSPHGPTRERQEILHFARMSNRGDEAFLLGGADFPFGVNRAGDSFQTAPSFVRPPDPPTDLGDMTVALNLATRNGLRRGWNIEYNQSLQNIEAVYRHNGSPCTRLYSIDWHTHGARGAAALFNFLAELAEDRNQLLRFGTEENANPVVQFEYLLGIVITGYR